MLAEVFKPHRGVVTNIYNVWWFGRCGSLHCVRLIHRR